MNSVWVCIVVGTLLGVLSALGVGGGSLLVLWLTIAVGMEQQQAQGINLLYFIPAAVIACMFHGKHGNIHWPVVIPAIIAGALLGMGGAWLATVIDTAILRKVFGALLLVTGCLELFHEKDAPTAEQDRRNLGRPRKKPEANQ